MGLKVGRGSVDDRERADAGFTNVEERTRVPAAVVATA
jgi:hypothetical protein